MSDTLDTPFGVFVLGDLERAKKQDGFFGIRPPKIIRVPVTPSKFKEAFPVGKEKWDLYDPNTHFPFKHRLLKIVIRLDLVRRECGEKPLRPLLRIGRLQFYNKSTLFDALGMSREAFYFGLTKLVIFTGERRAVLHGALNALCVDYTHCDGYDAAVGPACVWYYNRGNKLIFSDSRTGMFGEIDRKRCFNYIGKCAKGASKNFHRKKMLERTAYYNMIENEVLDGLIASKTDEELMSEKYDDRVSYSMAAINRLEYLNALAKHYNCGRKFVEVSFYNVDPTFEYDVLASIEAGFRKKAPDKVKVKFKTRNLSTDFSRSRVLNVISRGEPCQQPTDLKINYWNKVDWIG